MIAGRVNFREATQKDIGGMHVIRMSVKENVLSGPFVITEADYEYFLTDHGKGWVCEANGLIVGFSIVDTDKNNVWALFVHRDFEKKGIGKELQRLLLHWFFNQSRQTLWLGTAAGTRVEKFYKVNGWKETGKLENGEVRFEMTFADYCKTVVGY